jgi:multiple sugar transport system ATP-binding protein
MGQAGTLALPGPAGVSLPADREVLVGLRPQDCGVEPGVPSDPSMSGVAGTVLVYENLLEYGLATVELAGAAGRVVVQVAAGENVAAGDPVLITAPGERVYLFDQQSGERLR